MKNTAIQHILLVEDDISTRKILERRLGRKGFEVQLAADGVEALSALQSRIPQLILMDLNMPIMNGWDAIRKIRSDSTFRSIPILVLSAYSRDEEKRDVMELGCVGYLNKPVEFDLLLQKIAEISGDCLSWPLLFSEGEGVVLGVGRHQGDAF